MGPHRVNLSWDPFARVPTGREDSLVLCTRSLSLSAQPLFPSRESGKRGRVKNITAQPRPKWAALERGTERPRWRNRKVIATKQVAETTAIYGSCAN